MAPHIKKHCIAAFLFSIIIASIFLVEGQSTVGGSANEEQEAVHDLVLVASELRNYFREVLTAQIERLENRIERHERYVKSLNQELQLQNSEITKKLTRPQCPTGFSYTAAGFPKCYAPLTQKFSWDTAQQRCRQLHGDAHLAVINNALEQQIISQMILKQGLICHGTIQDSNGAYHFSGYYWAAGQLRNITVCNNDFVWRPDAGTSLAQGYTNWNPTEPNCNPAIEACIGLYLHGTWNDVNCTIPLCAVCEVMAYS